MAMSGTDKEIKPQTSSLPYLNIHDSSSSEPMDYGSGPDRFAGSVPSVTPISVGSRLLKSPTPLPRYRECLKNHAANIGRNITDGCGEFMPAGSDGTLEAFKCAACGCHRNFHRKETVVQLPPPMLSLPSPPSFHRHQQQPNWPASSPAGGSTNPPLYASPLKIAVGGSSGAATDSSSEELHFTVGAPYGVTKKRFRSKFSEDQKEKMLEFAEKVGWRIPREDDPEVQRFCQVVGVKRQVLKVWMHNNKATSGKKHVQDSIEPYNNPVMQ
ncbi:hypothetical protein SSX86_013994 [Deinandra increscens subsp. villosa]|uniref:ZF-HD dimerization-type domain-containing protein n=1 Tax=Deinandra increscens subsp. villosa TaxID=3103831 RepID=A0AAP0D140_9ASTR